MPEKQAKNTNRKTEHLKATQFKPGQTGNPGGRPKGSISLWNRVRAKLREKIAQGPQQGREYADLVADAIVKAVLQGKWPQTKELLDREEGPPEQQIGGTINVEVTYRTATPPSNGNGRMSHVEDSN